MKRVTVAGHSLHPMLVVFPLGLLATSLVWDLVFLASDNLMWGAIAYWTIVAGVIGGLAAGVPGLIDWRAIPDGTRAKRVGAVHGILNVAILVLFVVSLVLRHGQGYTAPSLVSPGTMYLDEIASTCLRTSALKTAGETLSGPSLIIRS